MLVEIFLMRLRTLIRTAATQSVTTRTGSRFVPIALPRS